MSNIATVDVDPLPPNEQRLALLGDMKIEHTIEKKNMVNKLEIGFVCDAVHLDKNIRSMLETHNFDISKESFDKYKEEYKLTSRTVKFEYVLELIEYEADNENQMAPRLQKKKVANLSSHQKMDVDRAMAVLSLDVAAAIRTLVEHGDMPTEALTTALFIELVARWFRIVKCRQKEGAFSYSDREKYNEQCDFLMEFLKFFCTLMITPYVRSLSMVQKGVYITTMTLMWSAKFCLEVALMDYFRPGTCLADCVENTHGQVRDVNPLPDAKLYLSILKGICLGQLFREKRKRGSSYELDDTKGYLSWLGDIKKMEQEVDAEAAEDRLVFIESPFDPVDYCQARAIAFHAGYVLFKVIKEKRKCDKCMEYWVAKDNDEEQELNDLIRCKEYKKNGMLRPTPVGNEIFQKMEHYFKANRYEHRKAKGQIKTLTHLITNRISEEFDSPACHRAIIIRRWVSNRMDFWARFITKNLKEINEEAIYEGAQASKTQKRSVLVPS